MQREETVPRCERFAVRIKCAICSQVGSATWEEVRAPAGEATGRTKLISVSNGFHTGDGLTRYGSPKIICDRCDTAQSD
jgi:hypothetical protein